MGDRRITVLMATRNGARHLWAQLSSIAGQSGVDWDLVASDDGSTDETLRILSDFADAHPGRVRVVEGPGRGAAANFLSLVSHVPGSGYAAFCDQDDVWMPHKLSRAMRLIGGDQAPAVYSSRTILVDADLRPLGRSPRHHRAVGFGNALCQNVLAGNTIVLNPAGAEALSATVPAAMEAGVPFHDWWTYLVLSGIGARIVHDPAPTLRYRQHGGNLLGHHGGLRVRLQRIDTIRSRAYAGWVSANEVALRRSGVALTDEASGRLEALSVARSAGPRALARMVGPHGVYRQTAAGDMALRATMLAGRF